MPWEIILLDQDITQAEAERLNTATATPTTHRTIRPIATYALHGIAFHDGYFWAIETINGYLIRIDPPTDATEILNVETWPVFVGATQVEARIGR